MTTSTAEKRIYHVKNLDGDYRREPKTDRFCVRCQKDIKEGSPSRAVHIVNGGHLILHPDDESSYVPDSGDCGIYLVGMDCAKIIGLEWTHPRVADTESHPQRYELELGRGQHPLDTARNEAS